MTNYAVLAYKIENDLTKETSAELMQRLISSNPKNAGSITKIVKTVCDCGVINMTKELNIVTDENYDVSITGKGGKTAAGEFNFLLFYTTTEDDHIEPMSAVYQNEEFFECECTEIPTYNIKIDNKISLDFNKSETVNCDVTAEQVVEVETPDSCEEESEPTECPTECVDCKHECTDCECEQESEIVEETTFKEALIKALEEVVNDDIPVSDEVTCCDVCDEADSCAETKTTEECCAVCEEKDNCEMCECAECNEDKEELPEKKGFFKSLFDRLFGR